MMPNFPVFYADADSLADNTEEAVIVLCISHTNIESCNIASALERLLVLSDTKEKTLLYRESLEVIVEGYDTDPRELAEIPEVRMFFAALTKEWPYWTWFLARQTGAVTLLMSFLCTVSVVHGKDGFGIKFSSYEELEQVFGDLHRRSVPLYGTYNIAPEDVNASIKSFIAEFG